jgi:MFS family permease
VTPATARVLVIAVPAAIYFVGYFHRVAPAVVAADLMRAFGITAASLAMLAAVYPYVFAAMALVAGSLADGVGPRWTLAAGGTTMAVGAALFGLAPVFGMAVAGRLLVALGASVILVAWLSLIAAWFRPDEFATAAGWTQSVGNLGALAASSPLALLVEAMGWRHTFVVIGALTLLLAVVALLVVRDRPPAPAAPAGRRGDAGRTGVAAGVRAIVTNRRTWPPVLAAAGMYATAVTLLGLWGVAWLTQVYGVSRVHAATTLAALALGIAAGSPLAGWLSDRWLRRRRLPFVVFSAAYALCWLPLLLPGDRRLPVAWLPAFLFVMGLAAGGLSLVFTCVREVNDPARVGLAVGFGNLPIFLGFALLQALSGVVLDARWQGLAADGVRVYPDGAYRALFALCAVIAAGATLVATRITETRCRNVWGTASRAPSTP